MDCDRYDLVQQIKKCLDAFVDAIEDAIRDFEDGIPEDGGEEDADMEDGEWDDVESPFSGQEPKSQS